MMPTLFSSDQLQRDLRHAVRSLRRTRGFSIIVVIVLAVATAAVTTVFALLNSVVLRPLRFPESDRLVVIRHAAPGLGVEDAGISSGLYFHYRERARSLESIGVYRQPVALNLRLPDSGTERVQVTYASAALFKVLRTTPALGRLFTEEDGRPGFMNMKWKIPVLISHRLWVDRFGADRSVIGRTIALNDSAREIVGVLPPGFTFPDAGTQIWLLLEPPPGTASFLRGFTWEAIARMGPEVTVASTGAELVRILPEAVGLYADATHERLAEIRLTPQVMPLKFAVVGDVAHVIWTLFGGMVLLLLVGCANAGGLFLVRTEYRGREMAVRRALGARGGDLASLFVVEAMVLTGTATVIGVVLASVLLSAVRAFTPFDLPRTEEIRLDRTAIGFAAVIALLMAAGYGVLSLRRRDGADAVRFLASGQWATIRRRRLWGPDALIAVQVAVSLTLMVGSVLMVRTYRNLATRELGFSPGGVLTVEIGLPGRKAQQHVRIYRDVVDRVRGLPWVDRVAAASFVPLTIAEHVYPVEARAKPVLFKFFVPGYFETIGSRIIEGTHLTDQNRPTVPDPVYVSAALARRLYPGESAVGKTVRRLNQDGSVVTMGQGPVPPFTIAGVVANVREVSLREDATEIVYIPLMDPVVERSIVPTTMQLVVHTRVPPLSIATAVRQAVASADPDLSVGRIAPMDSIVAAARARETFVGVLLLAAAAISLFLSAVGIYGTVAQVVRRRTREIGIRIALGARRSQVVRMVTTASLYAVLAGGALGLMVSVPAARMLGSLLFAVDAADPLVLLIVTTSVALTAAGAALVAASHAAQMAPVAALRVE